MLYQRPTKMNSWQTNVLQQNLASLIEFTRCTEGLMARLFAKQLLSNEEKESLTMEVRNHGEITASRKLYTILKTRKNGFFGLMESLNETWQTGAWNIFEFGIKKILSTFPVKISGETLPLNVHFTSWTNQDELNCLDSEETMNEFCKLLSEDTSLLDIDKAFLNTKPHPLYIPRFVSNRVLLDAEVFKKNSKDVFAFKGIHQNALVKLVDPHPVRSSTDQLTLVTCRHIYLDDDADWDDLKDVATAPLHLICREEGGYVLQRSTKITDTILNHSLNIKNNKAYISEEKFAEEIFLNEDTKGICVCDIPGMGKTWLMESVAKKLQTLSNKRTLVLIVLLAAFSKTLGELPQPPEDPLNFLLEVSSSSNLVSSILKTHAKRSRLKMILFLDGFDEIREDFVQITTSFLKQLITEDNVRLIISSRPRMRQHLEYTFKVISYDILPFGREEQVCAIVGQWQLSIEHSESQLKEYAKQCIRTFTEMQCDGSKNILGVPLKCYLLAEVNFKRAKQIAKRKKVLVVAKESVINSICDLYEKFVESRISKVLTQPGSSDMIRRILSFHTYRAFKWLIPGELPFPLYCHFLKNHCPPNIIEKEAERIGIMSLDSNCKFAFLHRSFAEYFVGKFFADFWNNLDDLDNRLLLSVAQYFLKNLLRSSRTIYHWFPSGAVENRNVLCFLNSIYQTGTNIVPRFKEALLSETNSNQPDPYIRNLKMALKDQVFEILSTCIDEQFRAILYLFLKLVQVFFDPFEFSEIIDKKNRSTPVLLYKIAASGCPEIAREIFKCFPHSEDNCLLNYCENFPVDIVSPLEVCIRTNDVDMFAYLFNKVKM